jgi:ABC-type transporter Mla subunit MlaD
MVGNKFLEMTAGTNTEPALIKGDVIIGTNSVSLDSVIENANVGIDSLIEQFKIFEKNGKLDTTLTQIAFNVEEIVSKLNDSLGKNGDSIKSTVKNINTISEDLNQISERIKGMQLEESVLSKLIADKKLGEKVESIINNLEKVSKNLEKRFR